jgi:hypothetical protein
MWVLPIANPKLSGDLVVMSVPARYQRQPLSHSRSYRPTSPANSETVFGSLSIADRPIPLTQIERKAVPILLKIDHLERDAAVLRRRPHDEAQALLEADNK